jgi:predicted secreted protein
MIRRFIKKILAPIVREILNEETKNNVSQEVQETLLKALNT